MRCAHGFWVFRDCLPCVENAALEKAAKKIEQECGVEKEDGGWIADMVRALKT